MSNFSPELIAVMRAVLDDVNDFTFLSNKLLQPLRCGWPPWISRACDLTSKQASFSN